MSKFLRESQNGFDRIDTKAGIIYGVKVLGAKSKNGRIYEDSAMRRAVPMYEGVSVNLNHIRNDPNTKSYTERPIQDRWGVLKNARFEDGSIYADLHYLKSHPATPQLVEAAARFPETFGLSHDAGGDEQMIDGERRVVELYEVRSVDVVADPATNAGLFESYLPSERQQMMESRLKRRSVRLARMNLLEVRDGDGDGKINDGKSSEAPAPPKQAKKRASQSRAPKKVSQTAPAQQSQSDQNKQSEEHFYKNKQVLGAIAEKTLGLETTETRNSDRLDFAETSVWSMRKAGKEAFLAGAGRPPNTKEQLAIDAVLKKEFNRDSLDTKNNSSDFSEIYVKSARIALGAIHKQGASSGSSSGAKKPKDAQTKLSQADRIARAERRSTRYARMANKAYSRGREYVDASKQVGGPMSDRLRARGDELVKSSRRLMGKSSTVKKAIDKVKSNAQK